MKRAGRFVFTFVITFLLLVVLSNNTKKAESPQPRITPTPKPAVIVADNGDHFLNEDLMQDLLCAYFENNGFKIKRAFFQPLIEKDDNGLYAGKERWFITLENGDQFPVWTKNGMIDYQYGNQYFSDIRIY